MPNINENLFTLLCPIPFNTKDEAYSMVGCYSHLSGVTTTKAGGMWYIVQSNEPSLR